jgi:DNA-binding beta-propeller fold protein YncE
MAPLKKFIPVAMGSLLLGSVGCSDAPTSYDVEPYEGVAFPNPPPTIDYPARAAFVTNSLGDTVDVIDLEAMTVTERRPVGRNPVDIDGPHHIAIDEAAGYAFIALSYPASDAAPGPHNTHGSSAVYGYVQKLRLSDLTVVGQVRIDPNPGDIVLSPDKKQVVVSHFDLQRALKNPTDLSKARARVAVIDAETLGEEGAKPQFITTCVAPHGLEFDLEGLLYVACYGEDAVATIDLREASPVPKLLTLGDGAGQFGAPNYGPYALRVSPDGAWMAVSNTVSKDVRFLATATGLLDSDKTIFTNAAPFFNAFSEDGSAIAIVTQQPDSLRIVDLVGETPGQERAFLNDECPFPHIVVPEQAGFLVVCEGDKKSNGRVLRLSPELETVGDVEVGLYPDAIVPMIRSSR